MRLSFFAHKVHGLIVFLIGAAILSGGYQFRLRLSSSARALESSGRVLEANNAALSQSVQELRSIRDLKVKDLDRLKAGLADLAQSKRTLYEAGLSLQDEKRSLEKLKEIMSTYLKIDEDKKMVYLMQGEQALEEYPLLYPVLRAFGGDVKTPSSAAVITSKERFAHPERGQSEEVNGVLVWNPPQVGQSVRSNALGEFVMFTGGPIILHGPPKKTAEHESFPHLCAGLSQKSAQRLYSRSFIGTKIVYVKFHQASPPPAPN